MFSTREDEILKYNYPKPNYTFKIITQRSTTIVTPASAPALRGSLPTQTLGSHHLHPDRWCNGIARPAPKERHQTVCLWDPAA